MWAKIVPCKISCCYWRWIDSEQITSRDNYNLIGGCCHYGLICSRSIHPDQQHSSDHLNIIAFSLCCNTAPLYRQLNLSSFTYVYPQLYLLSGQVTINCSMSLSVWALDWMWNMIARKYSSPYALLSHPVVLRSQSRSHGMQLDLPTPRQ